jgi:ATP-dependent exoDNAse (exonuclease V) beta subunit
MTGERSLPDADARAAALHPGTSFIVQAPAGSGKTTLLAERYLHLLGTVGKPEEILAITFTKKAAAEMRSRVLELLAGATDVAKRIRQRDAELGWHLASNANQLKIQTIDSFAYDIASQALGAANAQGLDLIEDATEQYELAAERLFGRLYAGDPLSDFIAEFLAFLDNNATQAVRLVAGMLAKRDQWWDAAMGIMSHARDGHATADLLQPAVSGLRSSFSRLLDDALLDSDWQMVRELSDLTGTAPNLEHILPLLFTGTNTLRKRLTTREHVAFSDAEVRRKFTGWLESLRERKLEHALLTWLKLPAPELHPAQERVLTVCCTCLAISAVELDRIFAERETLDFTGLLLRAQQGLREEDAPTDLALQWDYRISHVLVDEFQDTSRSQYTLFRLLTEGWQAGDGRTFFAVGDPMQSIYRFRDADVAIFMDCRENGLDDIPLVPLRLEANFRSAPSLVDWCNGLFARAFSTGTLAVTGEVAHARAIAMRPENDQASITCRHFDSVEAEVTGLVAHVQALLTQTDSQSIALLCRARTHLDKLLFALRQRNISWRANDIDPLSDEPVVLDLMSLHAVLVTPHDRLAWFALLRCPLFGLSLCELDRLAVEQDLNAFVTRADDVAEPVARLREGLAWARPKLYELPLREVIEGLWVRLGGFDAYDMTNTERAVFWLELVESMGERGYHPHALRRAIDGLYANPIASDARLEIMTIHKAKGLEFDHVIVPFLDRRTSTDDPSLLLWDPSADGLLLGTKDDPVHDWLKFQNKARDENEQKRLLYVAFTRAKQSLFTSYVDDGKGKVGGLAVHLEHVSEPAPRALGATEATLPSTNPLQGDLFQVRALRHLPRDYAWKAPAYEAAPSAPTVPSGSDPIAARFEVNLGNVVHRALAWLAGRDDVTADQLHERIENWSRESDVETSARDKLADIAARQIKNVLDDPDGRWIVQAHDSHASELPLTGIVDDEIVHIVIDRTFVADGVRWIVDFKTSEPGEEIAINDFLDAEAVRYAPQLQRYAEIAAAMFQAPIRTALYFTAIPKFHEIDL